jgi:hypothetical protein
MLLQLLPWWCSKMLLLLLPWWCSKHCSRACPSSD